ncbi:MAG: hypothetical protein HW378_2135 [Anaerolineales bacterium]|nr:hypothetical protein [Anaerolineales bacterium]
MSVTQRTTPITLLCLLSLALAACNRASATATPTPEPTATQTSAPTVIVPTLPPAWTPTPSPTLTSAPATSVPTAGASTTPTPETAGTAAPTETLAASPSLTTPADTGLTDKVEFVADMTVPDGTQFTPGTKFTKTWRVKNAGTSTWTTDYALVFVRGEKLGGPDRQLLTGLVPPGQTVDISVDFTAPANFGTLTSFWMLRSPAGELFGLGPDANQPLYVQVSIIPAAGENPVPTVAAGSIKITTAAIEVDNASVTGLCPHTFHFIGSFTSEGAGAVTYKIEAEAETPGFQITLPQSNESIFSGTGPRGFAASYDLEFRSSVTAQVWLHILSPADTTSDKLTITLTCAP